MLQPSLIVNEIVSSLRSIPELVTELGGPAVPPAQSILALNSYADEDQALERALSQMPSPSVLVVYAQSLQGNFSGAVMLKYHIHVWARARNAATVNGAGALSGPDLLRMAFNYPISYPQVANNLRYVDIVNGNLWYESHTGPRSRDELGSDFWSMQTVWCEWGDAGPDNMAYLCK
jgi:hypothetical protein